VENGTLIYENSLVTLEDIKTFILEGEAKLDFTDGCMRMQNGLDNELGQKANYVLWCPEIFPENIRIDWEFRPVTDHGLCILFFAAAGRNGMDLFDPAIQKRTGEYPQYHSGDINAFHVSYFRRKEPDERKLHTCNLRKSHGFHLVSWGADPIPGAEDAAEFYKLSITKYQDTISFLVNGLEIFKFKDDGKVYGDYLGKGRIGFRQLAPLIAEYRNLKVYELCA